MTLTPLLDAGVTVAGLDTPTACSLLTEGKEIEAPDPSRVVVFQTPCFIHADGVEQLALARNQRRRPLIQKSAHVCETVRQQGGFKRLVLSNTWMLGSLRHSR